MKARARKHKKAEQGLVTVAKSIGSTMGVIVGRVNALQQAVTHSAPVRSARRRGKAVLANRRKAKSTAAARQNRAKLARAARPAIRRKNASAKRRAR
jgi:hypothetical protein